MLRNLRDKIKKKFYQFRSKLIGRLGDRLLYLLARTCSFKVKGAEAFAEIAEKEKSIIMLWHNRLTLVPYILSQFTPSLQYAALISASRDGEILSHVASAYKNGSTIRVSHLGRFQALQNLIRHIKEQDQIVLITPDGPRGPRYEIKPGIALAALETKAHVFPLNWEAKSYWELKTWDRLRLPKPFTTIDVTFHPSLCFKGEDGPQPSLEEVKVMLAKSLPT